LEQLELDECKFQPAAEFVSEHRLGQPDSLLIDPVSHNHEQQISLRQSVFQSLSQLRIRELTGRFLCERLTNEVFNIVRGEFHERRRVVQRLSENLTPCPWVTKELRFHDHRSLSVPKEKIN